MSHPTGLPDLFVDRSLGRVRVPALLRTAGLCLVTLSERYGIPADESVPDDHWLRDAGERGEAVLMKDAGTRYRSDEKAALVAYAVRCFCLTGGNLTSDEMAPASWTTFIPSRRPAPTLGRSSSPCSAVGSSGLLYEAWSDPSI